jgi:chemotaxis protein histidine kinase CheA
MAIAVASYNEDLRACESLKRVHQQQVTPLDDQSVLRWRVDSLVRFWERRTASIAGAADNHNVSLKTYPGYKPVVEPRELFRPGRGTKTLDVTPPPSYEESAQDAPPDYTRTDAIAIAQDVCNDQISTLHGRERRSQAGSDSLVKYPCDVKVDFSASENVRMHAKKKKGPAAKPSAAKWYESDDEKEKAPAGDGGDDKGGAGDSGSGAGGSGAGGGGDEGAGGGGDDNNNDDDAWGTVATGKKAKKSKKKQEEEEAAKKAEEEAAAAAKKAEEEAAAAKAAEEAEKEKAKAEASPVDVSACGFLNYVDDTNMASIGLGWICHGWQEG